MKDYGGKRVGRKEEKKAGGKERRGISLTQEENRRVKDWSPLRSGLNHHWDRVRDIGSPFHDA